MGYTTDFTGTFTLDKPLTFDHATYLKAFNQTRRMKRDETITASRPDPKREAVGLPVGVDGEFFVGESGDYGQHEGNDVLDYNRPPQTQPGLWCQWTPTKDGKGIEWDGGEKFYDYTDWLKYIVRRMLEPWGYKLKGEVTWQGEDADDRGVISVWNNYISVKVSR